MPTHLSTLDEWTRERLLSPEHRIEGVWGRVDTLNWSYTSVREMISCLVDPVGTSTYVVVRIFNVKSPQQSSTSSIGKRAVTHQYPGILHHTIVLEFNNNWKCTALGR